MYDEDYDFEPETMSSGEVYKYQWLFKIEKSELFKEFSTWISMPKCEKEDYEDDFSIYLSCKYQGKLD